ncbi:MAG: cell division protein FtsQ/DivIB [Candidatus Wenzhouxiangella sp. M2_3B_020]
MSALKTWLTATAAFLGLAAATWWFGGWGDARHWPIRWLEVSGSLERVTAAQVRAAAAEQAGMGFFAVDVERTRAAIESLPWVSQATVSRSWPDALNIHIREQRAVARWNGEALIGATGELFEVAGTGGMQGLTFLQGPAARRAEVVETWRAIAARLNPRGLEIRRLELDPRGSWRVRLGSGIDLLLGREQLAERLERYLSVRADLESLETVERIDLRYPNGLAVTRRNVDEDSAERLAKAPVGSRERKGAATHHG